MKETLHDERTNTQQIGFVRSFYFQVGGLFGNIINQTKLLCLMYFSNPTMYICITLFDIGMCDVLALTYNFLQQGLDEQISYLPGISFL